MAEKYDLIFSLGAVPLTAVVLKDLGLQYFDYPFDKISGADYFTRMNMFLDGMYNFIEQKSIKEEKDTPSKGMVQYRDLVTGFIYNSDFNPNIPVENNYPAVKMRYDKYIKILKLKLNKAKKILIVYIENPTKKEDDEETSFMVAQSIDKLKEQYPDKEFKIIYMKNEEELDDLKIIQIGKYAEKYIFNFYRKFSEMSSYIIDIEMIKAVLTDIELNKTFNQWKMLFLQKMIAKLNVFIASLNQPKM